MVNSAYLIRSRQPFRMLGMDSDNGSEFINDQLTLCCSEEGITFKRSRAGRKSDNCYVELKNWSIVRRFASYPRSEGEIACRHLNRLYGAMSDEVNFFHPSMKCVEKTRDGSRLSRRSDVATTPCRRVLDSSDVDASVKLRLEVRYRTLNPAVLHRARHPAPPGRPWPARGTRRPHGPSPSECGQPPMEAVLHRPGSTAMTRKAQSTACLEVHNKTVPPPRKLSPGTDEVEMRVPNPIHPGP